jgi:hypothetical protein
MKNKIIFILIAAFLCMALCGCGMDRTGNRPGTNDRDVLPDVTPMISPDVDDGVVNDHDGIIGNGNSSGADHDGTNGGTNGSTNGGTNGSSPTTAPGTSQNP